MLKRFKGFKRIITYQFNCLSKRKEKDIKTKETKKRKHKINNKFASFTCHLRTSELVIRLSFGCGNY